MKEITRNDLVKFQIRCSAKLLLGLNCKITKHIAKRLTKKDLMECFRENDYNRIFKMKFDTVEQFLVKFKQDVDIYMQHDSDTITIHNYMNFLEEIGYNFAIDNGNKKKTL